MVDAGGSARGVVEMPMLERVSRSTQAALCVALEDSQAVRALRE